MKVRRPYSAVWRCTAGKGIQNFMWEDEQELTAAPGAATIQDEYRRLDGTWLVMQNQVLAWAVLFTAVMEILMFFVLRRVGAIQTSATYYLLKYVLAPSGANLLLLGLTYVVRLKSRCSEREKIYTVSIVVALCCFVIYTVHSLFSALYLIFVLPMMLTVIYADRYLTSVVSAICIAGKMGADLFIKWDGSKADTFADQLTSVNFWLSVLILATFYVICLFLIQIEKAKNDFSIRLEVEREHFREEAVTDTLTGVGNRQALREAFNRMSTQPEYVHVLAMIDLDDFKNMNDTCGHACGDTYLVAMGKALLAACGESTEVFRFGGDEFCVLFHGSIVRRAGEKCRELQRAFREKQNGLTGAGTVTLSIGIAEYRPGEKPYELLKRADEALYLAKQKKDCVVYSEME